MTKNTALTSRSLFLSLSLIVSSLIFVSTSAQAGIYAGAMMGVTVPGNGTSDNIGPRLGYGFDLGITPIPTFGIGAYYLRNSGKFDNSTADASVAYYGGEALFFVPLTGLHFGGRVGTSSVKTSQAGFSYEYNPFALGPVVGWDTSFLVLPVAFGIEYSPMFASSSTEGLVTFPSFTMHNLFATLRLSF